jgi:hypothetical protein
MLWLDRSRNILLFFTTQGLLCGALALLRLEAVGAVYGSVAFRLKRDARRRSTFSAAYLGYPRDIIAVSLDSHQQSAVWTTFGFVNKTFGRKEFLFTRRKHKVFIAIPAGKIFVLEYHK